MKNGVFWGLLFLLSSFLSSVSFGDKLAHAAEDRLNYKVEYDPSYYSISYPYGDIPEDKGVCTDVVIRAYRFLGVDLQKRVHEDMKSNFELYPSVWGLTSTDKNIDHRRVPNLMVFFKRFGEDKVISQKKEDYAPGDIVCWNLGIRHDFYGITHIGIVSTKKSVDGIPLIVHNIGEGPKMEDCLFAFRIIGHYTYSGNPE